VHHLAGRELSLPLLLGSLGLADPDHFFPMGEVKLSLFFVADRAYHVCSFKVNFAEGETVGQFLERVHPREYCRSVCPELGITLTITSICKDFSNAQVQRGAPVSVGTYYIQLAPRSDFERRVRPRTAQQVEMLLSIDGRFFATIKMRAPSPETTWREFVASLQEASQISCNMRLVGLKVYPYMTAICSNHSPVYPGTFALNFSFSAPEEPRTPESSPEPVPFSGPGHRLS
jgi:hypothetical protein